MVMLLISILISFSFFPSRNLPTPSLEMKAVFLNTKLYLYSRLGVANGFSLG